MAWKQLVKPYLDDSKLVATDGAGNILLDWCGWCLAVTQSAYGITKRKYPSAIRAWEDNPDKYAVGGMDIPIGLYVPVFYSGGAYVASIGHRPGHIVIAYRESYDKIKVWSSPYTSKPYFDYFEGPVVATLDAIGTKYGCKYLGWAASLTDTPIVRWEADPKPEEPVLTWEAFAEPILYTAKLDPTHLWEVAGGWGDVKDLKTVAKGTEFWAWGKVYNRLLGNSYLVDKECLEKKIAKGYNVGDMEIKPEIEAPEEPEKEEEPVIENPEVPPAPEDNPEPVEKDEENYKEISKEDFEKALEENKKYMEEVMDIMEEAGKDITFSATTKKIVYTVGDLLLLASAEVSPVITMMNATDPILFGTALTQALSLAGIGLLVMFKLLKAKSGKKLLEK